MSGRVGLVTVGLLILGGPSLAVEIRHVSHSAASFDPTRGETVAVRFRLSEPAEVTLHVYDGRDLEIRKVSSQGQLSAGEHRLAWDGFDFAGRFAPPEAYAYTLEARNAEGARFDWDVTDVSGGERLSVDAAWDPEAASVRYTLPEAARVRIRLGIARGGPLLRTLVDWVAREAGPHTEPWDGWDTSRVLDLAGHPALAVVANAFSLSDNTILVGPPLQAVRLIADVPDDAARRERREKKARMYDYPRQPIADRRDFPLQLVLPEDLERNDAGLPVLRGATPMRVEITEADLRRVLDQRCEVVFFLDGRLVFENEIGFLPTTWTWHPRGVNPGVHHITANVRGFQGHFGVATVKIVYAPDPGPAHEAAAQPGDSLRRRE